jgi:hypothetical protein
MSKSLLTLLLGIAFLGMVGCKKSTTYTGPNGEKVTVNEDGSNAQITLTGKDGEKVHMSTKAGGNHGEVTITGTDGGKMEFSSNEKGIALPKDFPKDAPIYSGGVIMQNLSMPNGMMVMIKTGDTADKIKEFYEKSLIDQGWKNETSMESTQGATLIYKKEDRTLSVVIATGDDTMIHLTVTPDKK